MFKQLVGNGLQHEKPQRIVLLNLHQLDLTGTKPYPEYLESIWKPETPSSITPQHCCTLFLNQNTKIIPQFITYNPLNYALADRLVNKMMFYKSHAQR